MTSADWFRFLVTDSRVFTEYESVTNGRTDRQR